MKRLSAVVAGGILAASLVVQAQAQVYSVNAVGYTKVDLSKGFSLISLPFNNVGGAAQSLDDAFGTNFIDSAAVYLYVPGTGYLVATYFAGFGWYDDSFQPCGTNKILRGEGFWVYSPSVTNVVLAGEVPGASNATNSIGLVSGYQLVSFAYPVSLSLTNSGLTPSDSDMILQSVGGTYQTATYFAGFGWYDDSFNPVDVTLQVGKGYWYRSAAASPTPWVQTKPYSFP